MLWAGKGFWRLHARRGAESAGAGPWPVLPAPRCRTSCCRSPATTFTGSGERRLRESGGRASRPKMKPPQRVYLQVHHARRAFLQQKGPPTKRGQHVTSAPCNLPTRAVMHLARHRGVGIVAQVDVPSFNGDCRDHVKPCTEHSPIPPSTSDFGTLSITKRSPTQFPLDPQQKASSFSGRCSFVPLP